MSDTRVIEVERRVPDTLDVKDLLASALDGFMEHFSISGKENRRKVLGMIAEVAREMKEEIA